MWVSASRWVRHRSLRPEAFLLAAACGLSACNTGSCNRRAEAKQVLARIDRMRDAPVEERGPHIRALAELTPRGPKAKAARDRCLAAYESLQAAHREVEAAGERLAKMQAQGNKPRYEEVTAADQAMTRLREAKKAEPACIEAVAALRRESR